MTDESKPRGLTDTDWEDMDVKAASTIELCLVDEMLYNDMDENSAAGLWLKLESLYMMKSLSNKLYLKKQLYSLRMKEGTLILEHMNICNNIVIYSV